MLQALQDTLLTLIQAVIVTGVPIMTAFVISYFRAQTRHISTRTSSMISQHCLNELTDTVWAAVAKTSQAYVDDFKEEGTFSRAAQTSALNDAKRAVLDALAPATKRFLQETYSDYECLLESKIEEVVRAQKHYQKG